MTPTDKHILAVSERKRRALPAIIDADALNPDTGIDAVPSPLGALIGAEDDDNELLLPPLPAQSSPLAGSSTQSSSAASATAVATPLVPVVTTPVPVVTTPPVPVVTTPPVPGAISPPVPAFITPSPARSSAPAEGTVAPVAASGGEIIEFTPAATVGETTVGDSGTPHPTWFKTNLDWLRDGSVQAPAWEPLCFAFETFEDRMGVKVDHKAYVSWQVSSWLIY